jgi:hypothetical protein
MRGMNPDRHVYLVTALIAFVTATAINVLTPRSPLRGAVVVPEARVAAGEQPTLRRMVEAAAATIAPAAQQRLNALL